MDVLHIDSGREMRGGQWQALYLMVGQKTIGLKPTLMARESAPLFAEAKKRGVDCIGLSMWRLWRESQRFQLVHAHDARSHTMAAVAARCPFFVSRRVAFPVKTSWASRWKYGKAARYLAISQYVADRLIEAGVPAEKTAVVFDGVPLDPPVPLGDRLIAPYWDDPRKPSALAQEAARLAGVELHVSRDLKTALASARALLYLSEMEGLGSGALLALSTGVPVIASRVGGLPEIVEHGKTGLLVANNAGEIAEAIRLLMQDRDYARRLGAEGRDRVKDRYTLAHMALRTLHEYRKVVPK